MTWVILAHHFAFAPGQWCKNERRVGDVSLDKNWQDGLLLEKNSHYVKTMQIKIFSRQHPVLSHDIAKY